MNAILHTRFAETFGWTLLHSLWQLGAIAALWAVGLACLRRGSANFRYVLACAGLLLMLAAPVGTFAYLLPPPPPAPVRIVELAPEILIPPTTVRAPLSVAPVVALTPLPSAPAPLALRARLLLAPCVPFAVVCYLLGAALMLLRLVLGYARLRGLVQSAARLHGSAAGRLAELARRMGVTRPVCLLQSAAIEVPTLIGAFKPVILLPVSALTGLSPDQLTALLAHELAHIRRHDYFANLMQSLFDTLLFYHPAVWWLSARIRAERELCCDDAAIAATQSPLDYARALATMESLRAPSSVALAARGTGPLLTRIRHILATSARQKTPRPPRRIVSTASAALLVMLIALTTYIGCNKSPTPSSSTSQTSPSSTQISATGTSMRTYDMRYLAKPDMDLSGNGGIVFTEIRTARYEALIHQIESSIAPDTWTHHGGTLGSITENDGRFTVTQSPENQAAVSQALEDEFAKHAVAVELDVQSLLVATNFLDDFRIGWSASLEVGESNPKLYTGTSIIDDWTLNLLRTSASGDQGTITMPHQFIIAPPVSASHVTLLPPDFGGPVAITVLPLLSADRRSVQVETLLTGIVGKPLSNVVHEPQPSSGGPSGARAELPPATRSLDGPLSIPPGGTQLIDGGTVAFTSDDGTRIQRHMLTLVQPKIIQDAASLKKIFAATSTAAQLLESSAQGASTLPAVPSSGDGQILVKAILVEADDSTLEALTPAGATQPAQITLDTKNLNATLREMTTHGKLEVLARPYLLLQDGQLGTLQVGQQVPFIGGYHTDPEKGRTPDTDMIFVGIQIGLRATVTDPKGLVQLDIDASMSSLERTDTLPAPHAADGEPPIQMPVLDKRSAQTSISVADTQTVVLLLQPARKGKVDLLFLTPHRALSPDALPASDPPPAAH